MSEATAKTAAAPDGQDSDDAVVAVVSLYVKTKRIYARAVSGWFAGWRWALVWATQLVFYGMPWLMWNGRPAVLFNLEARRFYIFDLVLYPQDLIYLTGLLIISAYALFLFTAVAGRLWCGYACPQTAACWCSAACRPGFRPCHGWRGWSRTGPPWACSPCAPGGCR